MKDFKTSKQPKRMVSLFAGIGGFELGFQRAGIKTLLSCEIDPVAQHVLKTQFPKIKIIEDVCNMDSLPEGTDILCAGFPCQDISTIGVKTGLSGERSSLVKEAFRLLEQNEVEWVIFENVPNMLFLKKGETISTIINELERLGYSWAYRMIDSLAFVPQRRRRVFVVASLHNDPKTVLLSDSVPSEYGVVTSTDFIEPCGFYWTEGKYAIGLYQNAIPTLKVGSSIGIPSAPAIAFPDGMIGIPDIRDAERLQGFPEDWTMSAMEVSKPSIRWRLVGNAVTVDVINWLANKIISPNEYDNSQDVELKGNHKWPNACWGYNGLRYRSNASSFPVEREEISLSKFLNYPCKPLSYKAVKGFESRLLSGNVHTPQFFNNAIHQYVLERKMIENE